VANEKTTFADAFNMADDVLHSGVRGVTDLMVMPGLINLDFADIRAVMTEMGKAMMGTGEAEGENRAVAAAEAAISNPLLDDVSMKGARGVLINITGGLDMTLFEVDEAANRIRDEVDPDANIIFGSTFNPSLEGRIRISVVATGIEAEAQVQQRPVSISLVASRGQSVNGPSGTATPSQSTPTQTTMATPSTQAAVQPAMAQPTVAQMPSHQPASAYGQPMAHGQAAAAEPMPQPGSTGTYGAMPEPAPQTAAPAVEDPRSTPAPRAADRTAERPFIAPPPMEATQRGTAPRAGTATSRTAAPQPSAHLPAQGQQGYGQALDPQGDRRRGPSLFSRVTGSAAAWARGAAADMREATPAAAINRLGNAETRPAVQAPTRPAQQAPAAQPTQQRLAGLDPRDRIAGTQAEEELLDIPAFLRRQAN
jgi:cell division protein FtsZ